MLARTLTRLLFRNAAHKEGHVHEVIAQMKNLKE